MEGVVWGTMEEVKWIIICNWADDQHYTFTEFYVQFAGMRLIYFAILLPCILHSQFLFVTKIFYKLLIRKWIKYIQAHSLLDDEQIVWACDKIKTYTPALGILNN